MSLFSKREYKIDQTYGGYYWVYKNIGSMFEYWSPDKAFKTVGEAREFVKKEMAKFPFVPEYYP